MPEPEHDLDEPTPRQALRMSRVLWVGLVSAQVMFGVVIVSLATDGKLLGNASLYPLLLYVSAGALVVLTPIGYFARNQIYKANWQGDAVTPSGYVVGNVILLAVLEAIAIVALISALLTGRVLPLMLIALLAVLVQVVNFPVGTPMQPRRPNTSATGEDRDSHSTHS